MQSPEYSCPSALSTVRSVDAMFGNPKLETRLLIPSSFTEFELPRHALMKYRTFGRTGWNVSDTGYGLWGMGGWSGSDDHQSKTALQHAAEAGCTFFDSAWGYGGGKSDRLLGQLLAANPGRRLYAASKIPPANFKWPAL